MAKNVEAKIKKDILQILGERDESIRQSFGVMDNKMGQTVQILEIKIAILIEALKELGMTEEKLKELSERVAKQAGLQPSGGEQHENQQSPGSVSEVREPSEEQEDLNSEESGEEYFSRN